MRTFISILLPLGLAACSTSPSKTELDAEVRRLCAIDGGIKVYETVKLPPEQYGETGIVKTPLKKNAKPNDEYYYEWDIHYLHTGNPELSRGHFRIYRQRDGRLLGESIYYGRGGGDIPGPWHDSSYRCPSDADVSILKKHIFILHEKE